MSAPSPSPARGVAGARRLLDSAELSAILIQHAYRGIRVQLVLRVLLFVFMVLAVVLVPPGRDLRAAVAVLVVYACWAVAVVLWTRHGGTAPVRWSWVALIADVVALCALTAVAGASDRVTWTADLLVTGFFVIPVLAATQLRPGICALASGAATAAYLAAGVATETPNGEPLASVLLRVFVMAAVSVACVGLSRVQLSRVVTIGQLAQQRTALLEELMSLEARERSALAEHLHDGALQYVLAARMDLEDLREGEDPAALDRVTHALTESGKLLRETVGELHPAVLQQAGLALAVRELADRAAARGGLRAVVETDAWPDGPTPWDGLLYGCARELLANVAKHARAHSVTVSLSRRDDSAVLVVSDDGIGVSGDTRETRLAEGHIGLASLQTRVAAAAGTMSIDGGEPGGTRVTITVPLG